METIKMTVSEYQKRWAWVDTCRENFNQAWADGLAGKMKYWQNEIDQATKILDTAEII